MNYLAHLHLGGQLPGQLLGSLYGDFVKGRLQGQFSPQIEAAIQLHRSIDRFTDSHPLVGEALSRFSLTRRRYAGIVLSGSIEGSFLNENDAKISVSRFGAGQLFGEALACLQPPHSQAF